MMGQGSAQDEGLQLAVEVVVATRRPGLRMGLRLITDLVTGVPWAAPGPYEVQLSSRGIVIWKVGFHDDDVGASNYADNLRSRIAERGARETLADLGMTPDDL